MKRSLTMIVAATAFSAAVVIAGSSAGVIGTQEGASNPALQQPQPQKEVTGKISAVDKDLKVVEVEGTTESIVTTASTRYAKGLSFKSLKPGMEVKIVAIVRTDGRLEALEVSTAS